MEGKLSLGKNFEVDFWMQFVVAEKDKSDWIIFRGEVEVTM